MTRLLPLAFAVLVAAAPAPAPAPAPAVTRGVVTEVDVANSKLTLHDDAGHLETFALAKTTRVTRGGKRVPFAAILPGDRASKLTYSSQSKAIVALTIVPAPKPAKGDADDAKGRAAVQGEVAGTDVLSGKISVRLGGGATIEFKVVDATKVLREAGEGKPATPVAFETLKVGDRVEVHSKDWKTADEIHAGPAR